jgi:hypothetical protein
MQSSVESVKACGLHPKLTTVTQVILTLPNGFFASNIITNSLDNLRNGHNTKVSYSIAFNRIQSGMPKKIRKCIAALFRKTKRNSSSEQCLVGSKSFILTVRWVIGETCTFFRTYCNIWVLTLLNPYTSIPNSERIRNLVVYIIQSGKYSAPSEVRTW